MAPDSIDVLLQPLGSTIEVIEAPLARYQPEIIVLLTNLPGLVERIEGHMNNAWRKHVKHKPRIIVKHIGCLLYTSPSPRDQRGSRMPSSA